MSRLTDVVLGIMEIKDENKRLRAAIRSFERANTEMRRAKNAGISER
jgi:hypothetical protein